MFSSILAFLSSIFFNVASLKSEPNPTVGAYDSLRLTIGFGAANALFSTIAYFFIEPPPVEPLNDEDLEGLEDLDDVEGLDDLPIQNESENEAQPQVEPPKKKKLQLPSWLMGRRALLLFSLSGGAVTLFILTFLLGLKESNPAKLPIVVVFIMLFTLFYSPGAGCVPFLYSAEVWPNEGRGTS
jgi:hypothetical protein